MPVQPFDAIAAYYDADFTNHRLGRWLRASVWRNLADVFRPGDRVLELGCGTGEDAVWLAKHGINVHATDTSLRMLDEAKRKVALNDVGDMVTFAQVDLAALSIDLDRNPYDGLLSNFGALNTIRDRHAIVEALAHQLRPGGRAAIVAMSRWCPWDWLWYLPRGQMRTGLRRIGRGTSARLDNGTTTEVFYPSPQQLRTEFDPYFVHQRTAGIGVLLPPTYARDLVDRFPHFFGRVADLDFRAGRHFPGTVLNDHFLIILERTDRVVGDA